MTMSRSPLILLVVLIASSSLTVDAQQKNRDRNFDDFRGQQFCATRLRGPSGTCCANRIDECSVPIAGTLCYCDQFCDEHINPDCCPDYENVCKGVPDEPSQIVDKRCTVRGERILIEPFEEVKVNCNLCKCRTGGEADCDQDPCMIDAEMIDGINHAASSLGWKAHNYTEFYGHKLKEGLTYRLGTFEPRVRVKSMTRLTNRPETLPREFFSALTSNVRDQGWCGSSWAVSTAAVASDRFAAKANTIVELSSQNILSCVKSQGCVGGHLDNAWRYLNRNGVADEDCYGYEAAVGRCRVKKTDNLRTLQCAVPDNRPTGGLFKMGPAYSLNNETDIMFEIFHYGPVQATMWVYPDFFAYKSGIYRRSAFGDQTAKGFHSVRLVGWGEERFGLQTTKYWLAVNSWGTWWADRGYFKILRGNNECGIENYVLSSIADIHEKPHGRQVKRHGRRVKNSQNN